MDDCRARTREYQAFPPDISGPEKTKKSGQRPPQQPFLKVSHDINIPPLFTWTILGWFALCEAKFIPSSMAAAVSGVRSYKCARHPARLCSIWNRCMPRPLTASNVGSTLDRLCIRPGLSPDRICKTVQRVFRSGDVLQIIHSIVASVIVFMIYLNALLGRWWSQKCKSHKSMNGLCMWTHSCGMITMFDLVSCRYSSICEMQSAEWADHLARDCSACSGIEHLPPYFPFHRFLFSKFRQTKFKTSDWYVLVAALAHQMLGNSCVPRGLYHWGARLPGLRPNWPPHYWHRQASTSVTSCGAAIGKTDVLCRGYILQIVHMIVGFVAIFMVDLPRQWIRRAQESKCH